MLMRLPMVTARTPLSSMLATQAVDFTAERISGAMTNCVFRCQVGQHPLVIVRVQGSDDGIVDRSAELAASTQAAECGAGPQLLAVFANGRVEQCLSEYQTATSADIRDPQTSRGIATALAQFHATMVRGVSCGSHGAVPEPSLLLHTVSSSSRPTNTTIDIHEPRSGSSSHTEASAPAVRLIDYDYVSPACVAFDIANHFCEWAADYHSSTTPPHRLDFARFPSVQQQRAFVLQYLTSLLRYHGLLPPVPPSPPHSSVVVPGVTGMLAAADPVELSEAQPPGAEATPEWMQVAVEALREASLAYTALSHLHWGVWGVLSHHASHIAGFDYLAYAQQRLDQYRHAVAALRAVARGCN
uniref:Choline kinase n=1 Tax=Chlamydomonas asymmetrica TaxID=51683 RepID=A0A125SQH2_9CHLO|nr:choline kinase [Chlamydomonas asymmetrica]